ncbi:MAG: DUF4328 domain-containing protein [Pirellulaceae bacterium]
MSNPYQPPLESTSTVNSSLDHLYEYKSLGALTAIITVLLLFGIVASIAETLATYSQLELLNRTRAGMQVTQADFIANAARVTSISAAALLLWIVNAISLGFWIVRAHKNLRAFGIQRLTYTPGWAFGWFFIPILNLVRPFQAMKELWQASHVGAEWSKSSSTKIVNSWWCLWLLSSVYGALIGRVLTLENSIDELIMSTKLSMAGFLIHIPLCLLALKLVRGIHNAQESLVDPTSSTAS